jgi:hypothetical protein
VDVNRDMTFDDFRESLLRDGPPRALDYALTALWWDSKGDWKTAHESAQQDDSPRAAWVHAYLHRKEGDLANASYWYGRAGKEFPQSSLEHEWREITKALLAG